MTIYVYLDESGSIHKNSNTKYFAVGGYFVFSNEKNKIISTYKKINKDMKLVRNMDLNSEIKSFHMKPYEKVNIFKSIQKIDNVCFIAKVFNKEIMKKEIVESNIFFNYAVKLIFSDCIIPVLDTNKLINFVVSVDNRNIRVKDLKNLENYLKTEFCTYNFDFSVTYYDSKTNFGIQLADLTVNTFYNKYKNIDIVKDVLKSLKTSKYRVSLFLDNRASGRIKKFDFKSCEKMLTTSA